jgi:UDP-glucose 4-epimerase
LRVLVTGAGGFVGRAVVSMLAAEDHEVTALLHRPPAPGDRSPSNVSSLVVDLADRAQVAQVVRAGPFDAVCHLAAVTRVRESFERPLHFFDTNVGGTLNLLRALQEAGRVGDAWTRFVFASTAAVYGNVQVGTPLGEDRVPQPANPYGASKLAAEQLIAAQAATGELGAVTLRCFNVAGAFGQHGDPDLSRVIPGALAVAAGDEPFFGLNGDGSVVREFVHVADAARAFTKALAAATRGHSVTLNVGSGSGVSVREVLSTVERVTGRPIPVRTNPPKHEPPFLVADVRLAGSTLGWSPDRSDLERIVRDAWGAVEVSHVD